MCAFKWNWFILQIRSEKETIVVEICKEFYQCWDWTICKSRKLFWIKINKTLAVYVCAQTIFRWFSIIRFVFCVRWLALVSPKLHGIDIIISITVEIHSFGKAHRHITIKIKYKIRKSSKNNACKSCLYWILKRTVVGRELSRQYWVNGQRKSCFLVTRFASVKMRMHWLIRFCSYQLMKMLKTSHWTALLVMLASDCADWPWTITHFTKINKDVCSCHQK